ncbi:MAG: peptidoglycan-binding domain-containing protein [Candidatus Omnitrophica bacterium]|nr:peptidoglycan-binding domain-containing protein [Candidatus Omnitrophota bacterium]
MKRVSLFVLVLVLGITLISCSKKQETLEEMQQPMSPEDLNRIKTETQVAPDAKATASVSGQATVVSATEANLEPLPPSGPYQPSAKEIQTALKNSGFYVGSIDGKLGPKSESAIEAFQKANGLKVDGKVGPKTWTALSRYFHASATAPAAGE